MLENRNLEGCNPRIRSRLLRLKLIKQRHSSLAIAVFGWLKLLIILCIHIHVGFTQVIHSRVCPGHHKEHGEGPAVVRL
jgi:hypothetical protein